MESCAPTQPPAPSHTPWKTLRVSHSCPPPTARRPGKNFNGEMIHPWVRFLRGLTRSSPQRFGLAAAGGAAGDPQPAGDGAAPAQQLVELLAVAELADDADGAAAGLAVGVGLDGGDVAAGGGDRLGQPGEHPLLVLHLDQQRDLVDLVLPLLPLDLDLPLGVVEEDLDVLAVDPVHRDPAAAGDVDDDVLSRQRVAALGEVG